MQKLDQKIERLKDLRISQRNNAIHYLWTENDDATGNYWKNAVEQTEATIAELEKEKAIIEKWKAAELEDLAPLKTGELRGEIQDLGDEIHNDIHHGECFYDKQMLQEFVSTLNTLEVKALQYWASNQETATS